MSNVMPQYNSISSYLSIAPVQYVFSVMVY